MMALLLSGRMFLRPWQLSISRSDAAARLAEAVIVDAYFRRLNVVYGHNPL